MLTTTPYFRQNSTAPSAPIIHSATNKTKPPFLHRSTQPTVLMPWVNSTMCAECYVAAVMSDSLWPHGPQPARLLCRWYSPGKNIGVGCHALLQGIFLIQGWNPCLYLLCLLYWQVGSLPLVPPVNPQHDNNKKKLSNVYHIKSFTCIISFKSHSSPWM